MDGLVLGQNFWAPLSRHFSVAVFQEISEIRIPLMEDLKQWNQFFQGNQSEK